MVAPPTAAARSPGRWCSPPRWRSSTATEPPRCPCAASRPPWTGTRRSSTGTRQQGGPARRRHFDRPRPAHGRLGRPRLGQPAACRRRDYRALALARPDVVPLLVTRPPATPLALRPQGTLRPLEDVLTLLTRAGFSGPDALHIYRALFGFLHGHVVNELQELVEKPEETDDLLRLGLHRLPIGEFPLLRSLASVLAGYDGAAELERGLDILLAGLITTLPLPREEPPREESAREQGARE